MRDCYWRVSDGVRVSSTLIGKYLFDDHLFAAAQYVLGLFWRGTKCAKAVLTLKENKKR
jgi:hypothetical protein